MLEASLEALGVRSRHREDLRSRARERAAGPERRQESTSREHGAGFSGKHGPQCQGARIRESRLNAPEPLGDPARADYDGEAPPTVNRSFAQGLNGAIVGLPAIRTCPSVRRASLNLELSLPANGKHVGKSIAPRVLSEGFEGVSLITGTN